MASTAVHRTNVIDAVIRDLADVLLITKLVREPSMLVVEVVIAINKKLLCM